jgi:hypothetical protein
MWFFTSRRAAGAVVALGFAVSASSAQAALTAVGAVDPGTKAPAFYTDANGLQLALCHPGTANCGPAVPGEDFYNMATATITTPAGGTGLLILDMTLAPNASGNPAVFNRVRAQLQGFPAGTYTITHPYGTDTVDVPSAGARGRTTIDIGCAVTAVGACNFADAMAGRYGPFLTAAPGVPAPPAGFIGDAVTEVPVIGSPLGTNFFRIEGPGLPAGGVQSNNFALMGKLFGGAVPAFATTTSGAFADQLVGSASATKTITVNSAGIPGAGSNLAISSVSLTGANAGDFAIAANTCGGANLASGATCTVGVTFTPGAAGARSASLTFADNTAAATHAIALSGAGTTPAAVPAAPAPRPAAPAPGPAPISQPVAPIITAPKLKLDALTMSSGVSLRTARRRGIRLTVFAPSGARVVKIRMLRNGHVITRTVRTISGDGIAVITLPSTASGRHALKRGIYTIQATPGQRPGQYGVTTSRTVRIR